jgi:hypothetical protein
MYEMTNKMARHMAMQVPDYGREEVVALIKESKVKIVHIDELN